jgi:hypothetical protein
VSRSQVVLKAGDGGVGFDQVLKYGQCTAERLQPFCWLTGTGEHPADAIVAQGQVALILSDGGIVPGQRFLRVAGPLQPAQALGRFAYEMEQPTQAVLGGGQVGTEGGDRGLGLGQRASRACAVS